MEFRIKNHLNTPALQWDNWVAQIDESTYLHTWNWLHYTESFRKEGSQNSFIMLDNQNNPLAICPLGISIDPINKTKEISLGGNPVAAPAIANTKPSMRRKIYDCVFLEIHKLIQNQEVKKIRMQGHPLTKGFCQGTLAGTTNRLELQKYELIADAVNTLVVDLSLSSEALLENVSSYHRKHLRKSIDQGIKINKYSKTENPEQLLKFFSEFKHAHFLAAGKMTRHNDSWDAMLKCAQQGIATLFVAFINEMPMSFLFCGEFSKMCFGWSQANLEKFEKEYSPRHLLEWEAIMYYKNKNFRFYELGERLYSPQWILQTTPKEVSIGEFKERYGGFMLPKLYWFEKKPLL